MRAFAGLSVVLSLALSLATPAAADSHGFAARSHGRRHPGVSAVESRSMSQLTKRFDNARFTFYADGLGACGKTNAPGDFIVALNSAQYAGGSHCFESITITANGKSTQASIVDECPGCPFGGLDLSEGLFKFFASESVGVLTGSWEFGSGANSATTSDDGEKAFTVRLPPRAGKEKAVEVEIEVKTEARGQEQATTVDELSLDDAFTIKPPPPMIPIFPMSAPPAQASFSSVRPSSPQLEQQPSPSADLAQGWITSSPPLPEETRPAPPALPPLQTVFSPMAAPSPQFGSPYGFAPTPALPPGIVLNQHGMPYEMATGRAVYLQQPMYDVHPRGVLPPHMSMPPPPAPFAPQHLRHPSSMSVSPDFLAHPSPPPMFAETPIFAPPRQSSRIEIRKPTADPDTKKTTSPRPSSLRSSVTSSTASTAAAASATPSNTSATAPAPRAAPPAVTSPQQHAMPEFYPTLSPNYAVGSPEQGPPPPVDVQMMGYPQYQQQYYYPPEQYGYAPPPSAYDMQHRPVQYDMYAPPQPQPPHPSDPRAQPVYY
ncbi:hypothetical protein EVG20_g668 [Dentipellis fragilis]|uniref:RlpA-like protein double-psi beta-barrel domain-containing protein n=1 Tax=Dentipellis fragilis TaxID=205917 RepID=A0A4Y9ZED6_9AGAM|nr:hypothetical protein EVG20_g668 [Dentipellis fragilis]